MESLSIVFVEMYFRFYNLLFEREIFYIFYYYFKLDIGEYGVYLYLFVVLFLRGVLKYIVIFNRYINVIFVCFLENKLFGII